MEWPIQPSLYLMVWRTCHEVKTGEGAGIGKREEVLWGDKGHMDNFLTLSTVNDNTQHKTLYQATDQYFIMAQQSKLAISNSQRKRKIIRDNRW